MIALSIFAAVIAPLPPAGAAEDIYRVVHGQDDLEQEDDYWWSRRHAQGELASLMLSFDRTLPATVITRDQKIEILKDANPDGRLPTVPKRT